MPAAIIVINPIGTLRRLTIQALKNLGYLNVHECSSTEEAQKKLEDFNVPLITILELNMAKLKDLEKSFIQNYPSTKNSSNQSLIVSIQTSDKLLTSNLQSMGVSHIISKDYDLQSFSHRLDQTLQTILKV
jgi:PleD family two-component response regulator